MSYSEESKGDEEMPFGPVRPENVQLNYDHLLNEIRSSEEYKSEYPDSRPVDNRRAHNKTVKRQPVITQRYDWNRSPHELELGEGRKLVRNANNASRKTNEFPPEIYGITADVDLEDRQNPMNHMDPRYDIESGQVPGGKSRKARKSRKASKSKKSRKSRKASKSKKSRKTRK